LIWLLSIFLFFKISLVIKNNNFYKQYQEYNLYIRNASVWGAKRASGYLPCPSQAGSRQAELELGNQSDISLPAFGMASG